MKSIIIGGGSIGLRHSENLNNLGITTRVVDVDEIYNIDEILKAGFDFGFVCSPTIYHLDHCTRLAENNIPIFCEKPFYTFDQNPENLLSIARSNSLITMVGCNLRFCEEIYHINPKAKYISVYFGYNLKKWRPDSNHLESYSSNKSLGGGILLDAIHELDYLYYKFGEIDSISCSNNKVSRITNDTEDISSGRIIFKNGTIADFSLNYLCENYNRYFDILENDTLHRVKIKIDNSSYVDEVKYFIDCIKNKKQCMNNFEEAFYLLDKINPQEKKSNHQKCLGMWSGG